MTRSGDKEVFLSTRDWLWVLGLVLGGAIAHYLYLDTKFAGVNQNINDTKVEVKINTRVNEDQQKLINELMEAIKNVQ